ncbi:MAG: response regulator [Bacteroidota bacterium]
MKYRVCIVDDEVDARALINIHLERHSDLTVVGEAANGNEAIKMINEQRPDLVFLDIEMPEIDGVEVVNQIAHQPYIVFVTAYNQFAIKAFELNAVDYLLKPFSANRFDSAVQKVKERLEQNSWDRDRYTQLIEDLRGQDQHTGYIERIAHKEAARTSYVNVQDIIFIESADQYIYLHTAKKKYLIRQSMDYLERQLNPKLFFRTHCPKTT